MGSYRLPTHRRDAHKIFFLLIYKSQYSQTYFMEDVKCIKGLTFSANSVTPSIANLNSPFSLSLSLSLSLSFIYFYEWRG